MSIKAEIIADSVNSVGCRLTTYVLEYPRFIHSEIMTHRVFSKNAASSRAIPVEKMIQQVIDNPAMPVWWGKNQSGMQAKEELDDIFRKHFWGDENGNYLETLTDKGLAKKIWLQSRDSAIEQVKKLLELGLHKQIANRILEPWFNIRVILSGTEFENFYKLRAHPDAQPEFQTLAYMMQDEHKKSIPKQLRHGEWHIPFGDRIDEDKIVAELGVQKYEEEFEKIKHKIAVARCARVSYLNYEGKDNYLADVKLCDRLFLSEPKHLSPTEHVAQALDSDQFIGNFRGFKQYRKFIE
jgi:thymidylate synthase ThyX